jgi:sugar O-acyltransferase (sialic acid O-acetyltransferase NeuD family)
MDKLIIIGAGGYAKSVLDSLETYQYDVIGFIDDLKPVGTQHLGYPILANSIGDVAAGETFSYFIAIGHNVKRKAYYDELKARNFTLINVIDRHAIVSRHAKIGSGCFIGKLAVVNNGAVIGNDCVINTRSTIEHGCSIHDHVNVSTNATLNGDVVCEEGCFVGSHAVINGQLTIGAWALVGSGTVVIRDVRPDSTVVGTPAHEIISDSLKYNRL